MPEEFPDRFPDFQPSSVIKELQTETSGPFNLKPDLSKLAIEQLIKLESFASSPSNETVSQNTQAEIQDALGQVATDFWVHGRSVTTHLLSDSQLDLLARTAQDQLEDEKTDLDEITIKGSKLHPTPKTRGEQLESMIRSLTHQKERRQKRNQNQNRSAI